MAELESGLRWWIRYVIVPIVAGGGVIAIVVSVLRSEQKQEPTKLSAPSTAALPSVQPAPQSLQGHLTVAVSPDTIGIKIENLAEINYRFQETAGANVTVELQPESVTRFERDRAKSLI